MGKAIIRLNLGCCDLPKTGYINIDIRESVKPDLVADVLNLSDHFSENSVDEIWASHLIEHLTPEEADKAVIHWKSLLKQGGKLSIVTPDFKAIAQGYIGGQLSLEVLNNEYIYSYVQESLHRCMYDQVSLLELFSKHDFNNLQIIDRLNDERLAYKDSLQVGAEGTK